jgi:hypothetical protein
MNGVEKLSKVTVSVKLWRVTLPPRITEVQFGFGHACGGAGFALTASEVVGIGFRV